MCIIEEVGRDVCDHRTGCCSIKSSEYKIIEQVGRDVYVMIEQVGRDGCDHRTGG